ncbi:ABC transporter substrate-binding protein [Rhodobacterales bacterium HKCCE3408]|nr:ABC transporter substrate-binding protein [Rhodobacterales bacterium HKCCE3408]
MKFQRRTVLKLSAAALAAPAIIPGRLAANDPIIFGAVAPKTGPLAGGAAVTHWPNLQLWQTQVNAAGGIMVDGNAHPVEIIEYDDQTNPGETIRGVQRLATQDNAHFIITPYGTGLHIAAAPIFDRYGYPQVCVTAITDQGSELAGQFPNMFFTLGATTPFAGDVIRVLTAMRDAGQIGNRLAMVNVADAFGIELMAAGMPLAEAAGFELVYETSYPLGTQDLAPVINGVKDAAPDAFVAWSYPPDTFGLTEQAMIAGLEVGAYYTAVATSFPGFNARFEGAANNILGAGGVNPDLPSFQEYEAAHIEVTGQAPDYWASATTYGSLQVLQQSIEAVGLDREAVSAHIKEADFDTVLGPMHFRDNNFNQAYWTVGQWQDGVFRGVASQNRDGVAAARLKEGWA